MKKLPALLLTLALATALLASCEMFVPEPTERVLPSFSLPAATENPADTDASGAPAPDESADPAEENYGFTVFPEGNYLVDPKFDTDEYLPDYDADPSFIHFLSTGTGYTLCQTESTVYACWGSITTGFIRYMDKTTGIVALLCGKPECLHDDSTCNAYVSGHADGLCVYDGKLYWESRYSSNIMRMNLDGTDREVVGLAYYRGYNNPTVVFHRGYVYFAGGEETIVNGKSMTTVKIDAQSLDGSESFTLFDSLINSRGAECMIKPVGNDLYIVLIGSDLTELYRWNSKTREVELISGLENNPRGLRFLTWSFLPVPGDGIYLNCYLPVEMEDETDYEYGIVKYSFGTEELEEILWLEYGSRAYFTRNYIISPGGMQIADGVYTNEMYAYDYNGTFMFSVDYGGNNASVFAGADDTFIYCCDQRPWEDIERFFAIPFAGGEIIAIG